MRAARKPLAALAVLGALVAGSLALPSAQGQATTPDTCDTIIVSSLGAGAAGFAGGTNTVQRFDATSGALLQTLTHPDFTRPSSLVTDVEILPQTGDIYVGVDLDSQAGGAAEIIRFDADGLNPTVIPIPNANNTALYPFDFDLDADGSIWLATALAGTILHVSPTGTLIRTYTLPANQLPISVEVGTGTDIFYGTQTFGMTSVGSVQRLNRTTGATTPLLANTGASVTSVELAPNTAGGIEGIRYTTADFAVDADNGRVQVIDATTGAVIRTERASDFNLAIDTDQQGRSGGPLFVSIFSQNLVQVINPDGVASIPVVAPVGVALASNAQNIATVTVTGNGRVENEACSTVRVTDLLGRPVANACVVFDVHVNGGTLQQETVTTNNAGEATFCFTPLFTDVFYEVGAFVDVDDDGFQDANEVAVAPISGFFSPPAGTSTANVRVDGDGSVNVATEGNGTVAAQFSVSAKGRNGGSAVIRSLGKGGSGRRLGQVSFDVANLNLRGSGDVTGITSRGNVATLFGTMRIRHGRRTVYQGPFRLDVQDASPRSAGNSGETNDQFLLTLLATSSISAVAGPAPTGGGSISFQASVGGPLARGNITINPKVGVSPAFPPFTPPTETFDFLIGPIFFEGGLD